ncbi:MAG: hemolysin III family protein [Planctomycetia bacterium]|nr:hemolysin III family protein [Planctomycetia bacterium]
MRTGRKTYFKWYTLGEEIANSVTHGVGALLSLAAMALLVARAASHAPAGLVGPYVVGTSIFGASLVILYLMSTLYHSIAHPPTKSFFAILDHNAIFILIAGTYTGYCLSVLYGPLGWVYFGIVWALAALGILIYSIYRERAHWVTFALYLVMGWLVLLIGRQMYDVLPPVSWNLLLFGGITYTLGCVFFLMKKIRWMHSIWHLFVLGGSVQHFFSLYFAI